MSEGVLTRGYLSGTNLFVSAERVESRVGEAAWVLGIVAVAAVLALVGIDNNYLWDDEAQVALFARRYLEGFGWSAWDGRSFFGYRNGILLDEAYNLSRLMPPLMFWVCVASFKAFGVSTWAARFPFAVIGILSLLVFWRIARREMKSSRGVVLAVALLGLSPGFLLIIRQCRYYSLAILFGLVAYLAYQRVLESARRRDYLLLVVGAVGLFYSTYLLFVAFGIALAIKGALFDRQLFVERFLSLRGLLTILGVAALTAPYFVAFRLWISPDNFKYPPWIAFRPKQVLNYTRDINLLGTLPWSIWLVALYQGAVRREERLRRAMPMVALVMANAAVLGLITPQPPAIFADTRYLLLSLALGALVTAFVVDWAWARSRLAGWLLVGALLGTNALAMHPFHRMHFQILLPDYVKEISAPYPTSTEKVVEYLRANAKKDDLVFAEPEYFNYPIAFYLGDHVRICCTLKPGHPLDPARVASLDPSALFETTAPDWFIAFGKDWQMRVALPHFEKLRGAPFDEVARLDVFWVQTQRGELLEHHFGPKRDFDRDTQGVYVYRPQNQSLN